MAALFALPNFCDAAAAVVSAMAMASVFLLALTISAEPLLNVAAVG